MSHFTWDDELVMRVLVDFDLRTFDSTGKTALMYACNEGKADLVKRLIEAKANVNQIDKNENSALMHTCVALDTMNREAIVEMLIAAKADVNLQNKRGYTALLLAILRGEKSSIEILLANGAKTEFVDRYGNTALHYSVSLYYEKIAMLLVEHDADINVLFGGKTEIEHAMDEMPKLKQYIAANTHRLNEVSLRKWKAFRLRKLFT